MYKPNLSYILASPNHFCPLFEGNGHYIIFLN